MFERMVHSRISSLERKVDAMLTHIKATATAFAIDGLSESVVEVAQQLHSVSADMKRGLDRAESGFLLCEGAFASSFDSFEKLFSARLRWRNDPQPHRTLHCRRSSPVAGIDRELSS